MSIFNKFKQGLQKTRDFVTESFNRIAANLGYFDEDMLDELEMVLVQADCGIEFATELTEAIRENIRQTGDSSVENVLSILRKGMLDLLKDVKSLELQPGKLNILLMVGVNGTGKTTTSGKLAKQFQDQGKKVLMAAADTFRAAAIEQIKVWGERTNTSVIAHKIGSDPSAVVFDAIDAAKARNTDVLIIDTAGRLHTKQNLMDELSKIRRIISREAPDAYLETLLVIDATTGQNAIVQANAFAEATEVTGLIMTKLDGNAKGGVALAVVKETDLPVKLAGLGEGVDDLQDFNPEIFVDSLLPDPESLKS
ncbi:MAG: signal recognition particle-docking protein FtsY [Clostridiaceae bacterium]|jgi:fused signal recognition particle receptor|nr:signal recognition particle-docking protein FtsY [Bacillota bacterium]NLN52163.1 signal recognition particle-docking protein FtsY [Clostridiaceae bacterium]